MLYGGCFLVFYFLAAGGSRGDGNERLNAPCLHNQASGQGSPRYNHYRRSETYLFAQVPTQAYIWLFVGNVMMMGHKRHLFTEAHTP